jgi:ATPase subunit of ABC transporter with duplicated ATPase domains
MIGISNLSKAFGRQTLLEGVSLQLNAGSRYGLVGANGSGKTTLLRILTGDEPASGGDITFPKQARMGILRQDRFLNDDQLILDVAMMGDELVWRALREQAQLDEQPDAPDPHRISELDELLNAHDGYTLESRASQIVVGLGIPEAALKQPLGTLSGGYKLRVLLAQVLVSRPDALFLDEPTNHLDILSIRWLERFLSAYKGCAVVISHDQQFLNRIATHILDVDYSTVTLYHGNYSAFQTQKKLTRERKEAEIARAEKSVADQRAFIERFKAKATKARQAQSRVRQLEKVEIEKLPTSSRRYPKFRFDLVRPSGKDVLETIGVCKSFGQKSVLKDVSVSVRRGERVGVIGANGLGKSTLLKILTGNLEADGGTLKWGHETHVGYFAQDHREQLIDPEQTAVDFLWDTCPQEGTSFVRGILGRLLFSGEDVEKKVGTLSGGEATRLIFSRIVVQKPNVLVLDEPTNHLDLEAIEALISALQEYEGTVVFVSHDRWFVSSLATRIIELRADGLQDFAGTYAEYLERQGDDHLDSEKVELRAKQERLEKTKRGKPSKDPGGASAPRVGALTRKRDEVLTRIEENERALAEVQERYCEPGYFERASVAEVQGLRAEEERLRRENERLLADWEALENELAAQ